jgi:hypothetical protein
MKIAHQIVLTDEYIAEAQRIAIAQNSVLRLMYQTWWIRWIPRFIFAGAAIAFWLLNSQLSALFLALMFGLSLSWPVSSGKKPCQSSKAKSAGAAAQS